MSIPKLNDPIQNYISTNTLLFSKDILVENVLKQIRTKNISDQIIYFYVVDNDKKLVGVLPLRRLISASPEQSISEVMLKNVVSLKKDDTVAATYKVFNKFKYLSLPVVDQDKKLIGVLDITALTGSRINPAQKQQSDEIFETVGIRSSCISYLTPFSAFRHRFPWLFPTVISGLLSAVLTSFFEKTISESIILACFLTMVLGLGESVSIQSLTITIRQLHLEKPGFMWYMDAIKREIITGSFLGFGIGGLITLLVYLWKGSLLTGAAIGSSLIFSLITASFLGLTIPVLLHKTKLDPKVSSGPLVLGLTDLFTLSYYFAIAELVR